MNRLGNARAILLRMALVVGLLFAFGVLTQTPSSDAAALPPSDWWLVVHDQCEDSLHWINSEGEFAAIPRPALPDEAAGTPCSFRPMHISQDGRYYVGVGPLTSGRVGIGFFDLQTGTWLQVHQAQPNESIVLGDRYSSDAANRIAVGFVNDASAPRAWRVIVFDMTTGDVLDMLRSDGAEIAGFVGGEFLATAATTPHVTLLADDEISGTYHAQIRFDPLEAGGEVLGAVAWYPYGAPGVVQELISSPYTAADMDLLPNRHAIFGYSDPAYPAGPPVGPGPDPITTNAIGLLRPTGPEDINPARQLFFADGVHTLYQPQWAADGDIMLFRMSDGEDETVRWVRSGTAIMITLEEQIAQILGVPSGFVYNVGSDLYFMNISETAPTGPVFSDPMLAGGAYFVWATAFGSPALALDTPTAASTPPSPGVPTPTPVPPAPSTGGPDLFVSEFSLTPATPVQGQPVQVRIGVYNGGDAAASGSFRIEWYPGQDYPAPACDWTLDGMVASGGRILTCTYAGYPSWYGSINTRVLVDTLGAIAETNEANNGYTQTISVTQAVTAQPDLFVSEFALNPATPVQGQPVEVRVGVYNGGSAAVSGSFRIEWYPGADYSAGLRLDAGQHGGGRRAHSHLHLRGLSELVRLDQHQGAGRHVGRHRGERATTLHRPSPSRRRSPPSRTCS